MSLDLGSLFATVDIVTAPFDRKYTSLIGRLRSLGSESDRSANGVRVLDESLLGVSGAASKATESLNRTTAASERSAKSSTAAGSSAKDAAVAFIAAGDGAAKLRTAELGLIAAQERLDRVMSSGTATTEQYARAQSAVITAEERVAAAQRATAATTARVATAQRDAAVATRSSTTAMAGTLKMAGELGLVFGAFEAVKKAIDITKEANDFQRAMVQVQTNADVSATEVHKASAALLQMAGPVAASPADLATAWYHAKSVGLDYAKSIDTTRVAAEGARVGHADLEETMNALTSTVASNIPGVENMSKAMGQLIAVVGSGDMKLSDLNDALGTGVLVRMKQYGLSLTDVGAALATFGDNNIRGADAATLLRMSVEAMAKQGEPGKKALLDIGIQANQLRDDMQKGGLNKAVLDLNSHLKAAGITGNAVGGFLIDAFTKKGGGGVAVLLGQVDRLESKFKVLRESGASFDQKWKATTQTASFALASLGHTAEAAGIALTTKLGPYVAQAARWIGQELPVAIGAAHDVLAPFAAAWGVLATALVAAAHGVAAVASFLAPLAPVLKFLATDVLATWAAFKGYQIIMAAARAIRGAVVSMTASARGGMTALRQYATAARGMLNGTATESARTAQVMEADGLAMAAASTRQAAAADAAAAQQAEAYAAMVAASDDATATMISNSQNYALAVQEQADASALAAAEITASADAAATGVATAGEEAAIGWSAMLGPLAAVGIGIGLLTTLFGGNDHAAEDNKKIMDGYAESLKQSSNALAAVNTNQTIKNLQDDRSIGLLDQLHHSNSALGISQADLVVAVNGSSSAYDQLHDKLQDIIKANTEVMYGMNGAQQQRRIGTQLNEQGLAAQNLSKNIDTLRHSFTAQQKQQALGLKIERQAQAIRDGGASSAARQARALGLTSEAYLDAQTSAKKNTDQTTAQTAAFQLANDAASLLKQALDGLAGVNLSVATAQTSLASANLSVASSFKTNGSAIRGASQAAVNNQQAIQQQVSAAQQYAEAVGTQTGSSDKAVAAFKRSKNAMEDQLRSQGKLTPAVQRYIDKLYNLSNLHVKPTQLDAKTEAAQAKVKALQDRINAIRQSKVPGLTADSAQAQDVIAGLQTRLNAIKQGAPPTVTLDDAEAFLKLRQLQNYINLHSWTVQLKVPAGAVPLTYVPGVGPVQQGAGRASGGSAPEGYFSVGEQGPEIAHKRGNRVDIMSNSASKRFIAATGARFPGFAGGTLGGNALSIAAALRSALGLDRDGLAGVLGNLKIESGFNPNAIGGPAHGIAQWQDSRFAALKAFAAAHNRRWSNFGIQKEFLIKELRGMPGLVHTLQNTKSASGAAAAFDAIFERSDGRARGTRMSAATAIARQLRGANLADGAQATANGTNVGPITRDGKDYVFGGQRYASERAAENARNRAIEKASKDAKEQVKNIRAAAQAYASARIAVGVSVGKLFGVGKNGVARGSVIGASDIVNQLTDMEKKLQAGGVSKKTMEQLRNDNAAVYGAAVARNKVAGQLMTAQKHLQAAIAQKTADTQAFHGAVLGTFDVTSAGADDNGKVTRGRILAQEKQAVTRARSWVAGIKKLSGLKIFPGDFLRQLAAKGPDALPEVQALAGMSLSDLKVLRSNYLELSSLGSQAGIVAARRLDQPGVDKYSQQVKLLEKRELELQRTLVSKVDKTMHDGLEGIAQVVSHMHIDWPTGSLSSAVTTDERKKKHGRGHS